MKIKYMVEIPLNGARHTVDCDIFQRLWNKGVISEVCLFRAIHKESRGTLRTFISTSTRRRLVAACRFCDETKSCCNDWKRTQRFNEFYYIHICKASKPWLIAAEKLAKALHEKGFNINIF